MEFTGATGITLDGYSSGYSISGKNPSAGALSPQPSVNGDVIVCCFDVAASVGTITAGTSGGTFARENSFTGAYQFYDEQVIQTSYTNSTPGFGTTTAASWDCVAASFKKTGGTFSLVSAQNAKSVAFAATPVTIAPASTPTVGDLLIICFANGCSGATAAVSDSSGNSWAVAVTSGTAEGDTYPSIWYAIMKMPLNPVGSLCLLGCGNA